MLTTGSQLKAARALAGIQIRNPDVTMRMSELLVAAWRAGNDKARELRLIV
jgi:hypothetical protein